MTNESELNKATNTYLSRRQVRPSENARGDTSLDEAVFSTNADADASASFVTAQGNGRLHDPTTFVEQYRALSNWVSASLDLYKPELRAVLFPLYVHSYLDIFQQNADKGREFLERFEGDHIEKHAAEIQKLKAISAAQFRENDLVKAILASRYNVKLCSFSYELLVFFLHDNGYSLMMSLITNHLNIQTHPGRPSIKVDEESSFLSMGPGMSVGEKALVPVLWGAIEPDIDAPVEGATKRKAKADEPGAHVPPPDRIPKPKPRDEEIQADLNALKEMRQRIHIGPSALPSICCYTFHNTNDTLSSLTISDDSSLMCAGFSESHMSMHNLRGETFKAMKAPNELPTILQMDAKEVASLDRFMEDSGRSERRLIGHAGPVYSTSISRENQFLLSASEDATVRMWSLQTWSNLVAYKGHNSPVWDVQFAPIGFYFATASHDRTARLWSCDHITPLRIFAGHHSDVNVVRFHPNSNYIATGSSDNSVRLWDVQSGNTVRVFPGHTGAVHALAFSPDGRSLASAGEDGVVMHWDISSGKRIKRLAGHRGCVQSLSFSVDNAMLASGAMDNTVRLWDVHRSGVREDKPAEDGSKTEVSADLLGTFTTKAMPVQLVHFTHRNILLAGGAYSGI